MEPENTPKKISLVHNILDELKSDNFLQKLLQPLMEVAKDALYPYVVTHLIIQLLVIILLLIIIYILLKRCKN